MSQQPTLTANTGSSCSNAAQIMPIESHHQANDPRSQSQAHASWSSSSTAMVEFTTRKRSKPKPIALKIYYECGIGQPEYCYSGAQLKKQGKRVCKLCVTIKNQPKHCITCNTQHDPAMKVELKECNECDASYCSDECLKVHQHGRICEILKRMPVERILLEDRLDEAELRRTWPSMYEELKLLAHIRDAKAIARTPKIEQCFAAVGGLLVLLLGSSAWQTKDRKIGRSLVA
jgi:hypothetical protein